MRTSRLTWTALRRSAGTEEGRRSRRANVCSRRGDLVLVDVQARAARSFPAPGRSTGRAMMRRAVAFRVVIGPVLAALPRRPRGPAGPDVRRNEPGGATSNVGTPEHRDVEVLVLLERDPRLRIYRGTNAGRSGCIALQRVRQKPEDCTF
jgi:hypothetical protein